MSARAIRWARPVLAMVMWTIVGLGFGVVASGAVPALFGMHSMRVLSGSMEPAISTGDVVIVQPIAPVDARVGDVVSFTDPEDRDRIISHRVRSLSVTGTSVAFVTRGDANTGVERWSVPVDGTIGLVRYHIPRLGYLLGWLGTPVAKVALIVVPALLLGAHELRRIWSRSGPVGRVPGAAA